MRTALDYKDYYKIMGVDADASQDEIKRAYRKLARKYHPDVSSEAEAERRFKEVGEAYEVLKDPEKRAAYDQLGSNWQQGQEFRPPPGWEGGFQGGGSSSGFSDFFESLFGQGFASSGRPTHSSRQRGEDQQATITVDLEDSYQGARRSIRLSQPEMGRNGQWQSREKTLNVTIPKGIRSGQKIRLAKQGNPGPGGGPAGDLLLEVSIRQHRLYQLEGADVTLKLPITPWEAALGSTVKVPTPAGKVDLKIAAGSQSGQRLRLKGRGLPGKQPGDFYVVLNVVMPKVRTDEDRALFEQMSRQMAFEPRQKLAT